jgi:hypothetical protein
MNVALVLFEMLESEEIEANVPNLEAPERNALWQVQASLEKAMVEPFSEDYKELLEKARASLIERFGQ